MIYLDESIQIKSDKILKETDLVLATIGSIGKINLVRNFKGATFSNNTVVLRFKNRLLHNPIFYEKFFQTSLMQNYIWGLVAKKLQPSLQIYELQNIKIPFIPKITQDKIVFQIEPLEQEIKELKNKTIDQKLVVNEVFSREFGFNVDLFNEFGKGMTAGSQIGRNRSLRVFQSNFEDLSRSKIVRFSTRFHSFYVKN